MTDGASRRGTEIFANALSPEALRALVEGFVTLDGTDYGVVERSVEEKIAQVTAQLLSGEASIVFDPETKTANIVATQELRGRGAP
jgi:uncharacterized protein YheU (UPF0270 family)